MDIQAPAPIISPGPAITAEVTQILSSATDAQVTLAVRNAAPASRPETTVPITGQISGFGAFAGQITFPAIDSLYTGTVTLDVPPGVTVANLEDGPDVTTDESGQHLAYAVAGLDGGADWTSGFGISVAAVPARAGDPSPSTPITATPATGAPQGS